MNAIEKRFYQAVFDMAKTGFTAQCVYHHTKIEMKIKEPEIDYEENENIYITAETISYIDNVIQYTFTNVITFEPQIKINNGFIVDFCLTLDYPEIVMAIEIDGHEWHEKTKEQASKDKERSRYLLREGFPEIRFSGSEVYTKSIECAKESINTFLSIYLRTLSICPESYYAHIAKEPVYGGR